MVIIFVVVVVDADGIFIILAVSLSSSSSLLLLYAIDMQQATDEDVSTQVINEDAFSVVANKVSLLPREPAKDDDSSCTPTRSLSVNTRQSHHVKISASMVKSIHHFCVLPDGLQLPAPYRGVWQQHHRQMSSRVSECVDCNICVRLQFRLHSLML